MSFKLSFVFFLLCSFWMNNLKYSGSLNCLDFSKDKTQNSLVYFLILFTVFFPSSIDSDFYRVDISIFGFILFGILFFLLYFKYYRVSLVAVATLLLLISVLLFKTIISDYSEYAFGYALSLLPMLMLGSLRVRRVPSLRKPLIAYYSAVILVFILAYAGFVFQPISYFIVSNYSGGYVGLSNNYQNSFRPVSIFISHSYAGFFYFLLIFSSRYLIFYGANRILNCLIICICLFSLLQLNSGSSYFFFLYSLIFLGASFVFCGSTDKLTRFLIFVVLLFFSLFSIYYLSDSFSIYIERIIGDDRNGLLSRYTDGVLKDNIQYILENPLVGIGFSYSTHFYYTDSDYIVSLLRFGLVGAVIYYFYMLWFLFRNFGAALNSFFIVFFISSFLFFMVSMPVFSFLRTAPVLILLALLFNAVALSERQKSTTGTSS